MDGYAAQLQAEAAESEGILPQPSEPSTPRIEEEGTSSNNGSSQMQTNTMDSLPSLSTVFGFAASWGKKLQADLQIEQFVDQVKKQSEEVTKAYTQDIAEFAQAVKTGASRSIGEISTRFSQIKTDIEAEFNDNKRVPGSEQSGQSIIDTNASSNTEALQQEQGLFGNIGRRFQVDALRQQQEKAKRLMSKLGADLEDLLRDAIVIEAPGSASTEEQKTAARKIIYDRRMAQLAIIQESEGTYLVDPSAQTEYAEFIKQFELDQKKDQIDNILKDNEGMSEMMNRLILEQKISRDEFWTRYFFHEWMVDQEEARRRKLVEAAVAATAEDEFSWDAEDEEKEDSAKAGVVSDTNPVSTAASPSVSSTSSDNAEKSSAVPPDAASSNAVAAVAAAAAEPVAHNEKSDMPAKTEASSKSEDKNKSKIDNSNSNDDDGWDEWE